MKTLIMMLSIKFLVIFPMAQQPDSTDRSKGAKTNAAKGKTVAKPARNKGGVSGGLLYRIPLSI
jgi:hypothetical protein